MIMKFKHTLVRRFLIIMALLALVAVIANQVNGDSNEVKYDWTDQYLWGLVNNVPASAEGN